MEVLTPSTALNIHATSMVANDYKASELGRTLFLVFLVFVVVVIVVDMERVFGWLVDQQE